MSLVHSHTGKRQNKTCRKKTDSPRVFSHSPQSLSYDCLTNTFFTFQSWFYKRAVCDTSTLQSLTLGFPKHKKNNDMTLIKIHTRSQTCHSTHVLFLGHLLAICTVRVCYVNHLRIKVYKEMYC